MAGEDEAGGILLDESLRGPKRGHSGGAGEKGRREQVVREERRRRKRNGCAARRQRRPGLGVRGVGMPLVSRW